MVCAWVKDSGCMFRGQQLGVIGPYAQSLDNWHREWPTSEMVGAEEVQDDNKYMYICKCTYV